MKIRYLFSYAAIIIFSSCSGTRMVQTELYFGQSRPDGTMITDAEWESFKNLQLSHVFREGSTVIRATGSWYDPDAHKLISEPTYVVVYSYQKSKEKSAQIDSLRNVYKAMFRQQSVLRIDKKVRASFN